jgi:hypothetical protein
MHRSGKACGRLRDNIKAPFTAGFFIPHTVGGGGISKPVVNVPVRLIPPPPRDCTKADYRKSKCPPPQAEKADGLLRLHQPSIMVTTQFPRGGGGHMVVVEKEKLAGDRAGIDKKLKICYLKGGVCQKKFSHAFIRW